MTAWLEFDVVAPLRDFELRARARIESPVVGLFGPSGAGKTSLLHALAGLGPLARGFVRLGERVLFDSERGIDVPPHRRRLGLVFQEHLVFPHLSALQNLRYGWRLLPAAQRRFGFDQIVELLELGPLLAQRPRELSGGERQRVALGRALLASPDALLLDEPLSSLDRQLKGKMLRFLQRVQRELALPMLWISHSLVEIRELTDELLVLERGALVAAGSYAELVRERRSSVPWHEYGIGNLLHALVLEHDDAQHVSICDVAGQRLLVPGQHGRPGEKLALSIEAKEIALALGPVRGTSIQNDLHGPIRTIAPGEERVLVEVALDAQQTLLVEISHGALEQLGLAPGQHVHCLIKARSLIPRFEDRVD